MKALVKSRAEPGLWLEDVPEPRPGINDVKIRVLKTGICGTDLHIHDWDAWAQKTIPVPLVIGHEFVGEIAEVGSNVSDFHPGDLVSGEGHVVCGRCRNCLAGRRHLCAHTQGVGVNRPGAFAEYIVLPMTNVWRHAPAPQPEAHAPQPEAHAPQPEAPAGQPEAPHGPNAVPLDVAAIFDPLGNAVHTALAFPVLGEDVLVTGAGPIGIMAAAVARHAGARHVVITDPNPDRRALAQKAANITLAVDTRETPLQEVQQRLGMSEGFDIGLEMSGNPHALRDMIANMSHGGKVAMLGIPSPTEMSIDWHHVIFNQLTLRGVYGREMYETWYKMTVMLQSGLKIDQIITHRYSWRDYEQGFQAMRTGGSGKVILDWSDVGRLHKPCN